MKSLWFQCVFFKWTERVTASGLLCESGRSQWEQSQRRAFCVSAKAARIISEYFSTRWEISYIHHFLLVWYTGSSFWHSYSWLPWAITLPEIGPQLSVARWTPPSMLSEEGWASLRHMSGPRWVSDFPGKSQEVESIVVFSNCFEEGESYSLLFIMSDDRTQFNVQQ